MPSPRSPISGRGRRVQAGIAGLLAAALGIAATAAHAADPLNTVRAFCRADGAGARLNPSTWPAVADLVAWPLEPAWDHLLLIRGYEIGTPRTRDGALDVEIQYTLAATVRSSGVTEEDRIETRTLTLVPEPSDGRWRIRAPAPPPHVFASQADAQALRALLDPGESAYVSSAAFVWQLLRGSGWEIPYADVAGLATAPSFSSERTAEAGDLAVYYDGDTPYHVAMVESDDGVVSATLNGGIRRTPFGAFAGEIRYRRPLWSEAQAAATQPPVTHTPTPAVKRRRHAAPTPQVRRRQLRRPTPRPPTPRRS